MELTKFDALQTFYVDADAVNGSNEVWLTSIEVFFKKKPTTSAIVNPGVMLAICDVENDKPLLDHVYDSSLTRVEYSNIYTFSDASVGTSFVFNKPIMLKTNRFYGMVLNFDDLGFELWTNKQGDRLVGTNTPSPGINSVKDGKYFNGSVNASVLTPLNNIDLKYKVNIAKFTSNTLAVELVNKDYEFLTISGVSGTFVGGEYVYKRGANSAGTLKVGLGNNTILGTGTDFSTLQSGSKMVILGPEPETNGTILTVSAVVSNTSLQTTSKPLFTNTAANYIADVVGKVYSYDPVAGKLILTESTANTSKYLQSADVLVGSYSRATANVDTVDSYPVDRVVPMIGLTTPSITTYSGTYNFSYSNGSAVIIDASKERSIQTNELNEVNKYGAMVQSRSLEVNNSFLYDNVARKSAITKLTFNVNAPSDRLFTSPAIDADEIDFYIQQSAVTYSHTKVVDGVTYDTEVGKNGTAGSKHFSKKVTFANNRFSEDLRVFADIYRPPNTNVLIYAKLHNSSDPEAFDDKAWTPLTITENGQRFSSTESRDDYIEYTFSLPDYPEAANTAPGVFEVQSGNTIVVGTGVTVDDYVTPGDLIRLYNPLEPETNYFVTTVTASNSSAVTISTPTANSSVLGSGMKMDKLKYATAAFNDPQNDNICTYFNDARSKVTKFDTMQIKVVFTATNTYYIPRVSALYVLGVSA